MKQNKLLSSLHRINPFRRITLLEDAEAKLALAKQRIVESDNTIMQASYIRHLAAEEVKAINYWLTSQKGRL